VAQTFAEPGRGAPNSRIDRPEASHHFSARTAERATVVVAFILGFDAALGRYVDQKFGQLPIALAIAVAFALYGWWKGADQPIVRRYLRWATPFFIFALLSLAADGGRSQFSLSVPVNYAQEVVTLTWFVLIAGVAVTLQNARLFRAFVYGLIAAGAVYLLAAFSRIARGEPALNNVTELLHLHRNIVDTFLLSLVPIVLTASFVRLPKAVRYAYLAGSMTWLLTSRGRTGLLGLCLVPILLFALKPSRSGKPVGPRVFAAAAIGLLGFNFFSTTNVSWIPAAGRISQAEGGTKSDSDEIRILLLKKSWALTKKHPVFGVGLGRFEGAYDPVVETARDDFVREQALLLQNHNTYMEVLASVGVPGLLLFLGMLLGPLAAALSYCDDKDVRAVATSYTVVLFCISFHTIITPILFAPMILLLTVTMKAANEAELAKTAEAVEALSQ
jgi:O-antigen ligase